MRFSFLAVAISLTASMIVSACGTQYSGCKTDANCCPHYQCTNSAVSMSREDGSARSVEVEPGARVSFSWSTKLEFERLSKRAIIAVDD
ncbi:uncharacterized protein F5891DRAFT_1070231 [Suillus fuscotomentosus]|uniref:Uncharacterized protein n=1 Tax=Suillus fuscotomentosus TaxID=1912939 RepID=A0AAD4HDD8_9AGAM|nr:uncharacterized protein F5891DRAFT_1070231 [Suillus fuscotomentosus]KAG1891568.1 hypothetical protein F5891DRAFT_1070231 [Suillus fuscotomentosus]